MRSLVPRSLTSRLVVTAVTLVAVVGILVALSSALVMRGILTDRLDDQVTSALARSTGPGLPIRGNGPDTPNGRQSPGTLIAIVYAAENRTPVGGILGETSGAANALPVETVRSLAAYPRDGRAHSTEIDGVGYRIRVDLDRAGNLVVVGLPTASINETLTSLTLSFALLTLVGVGVAGVAGTWLVRRQLQPLHQVAETARLVSTQDLSSGETAIATRVGTEITEGGTEVGQVGTALNTLLDHVDAALAARHRSEQQVRQFVADASHELRTPLSTIHGYAELSRRTPEDPDALLAALSKVETEAGRMSALVEDLLLLARLDAGRPLAREDVDVTRLLLEAVADARVLSGDHHWRLELPDEPVTLVGDAARLHQVLTNLLTNARHHTPAGTTVTVSARPSAEGAVRIAVHDDGPGMPTDLAGAAFERFTRGDSSRTRASGGAGLGLSLVSAIVTAHGGSATVTTEPGNTTFSVTIPGPEAAQT